MKKIYYLSALAALATTSAFAQYTIPEENAALQGEDYHMQLYKAYDFATPAINGVAVDGAIEWNGETSSEFYLTQSAYSSVRCSTEGFESFWYQIAAPTWNSGKGITTNGSGPRGFAMSGMKAGQILVVQGRSGGNNSGGTSSFYNGFCVPNGKSYKNYVWSYADPLQVEDISEAVNTANGIVEGEDYEGSPYLYLRVLQDGWVSLTMERAATICGVQVWNDAEADETITDPSIKMSAVYEDNRTWSWKPGESSLGSSVTTYYSFGENDPIYRDEDGKPVLTDGYYGENILEEGNEIESLAANDEDFGEGNTLKVNIASVSELGNASEIVTYEFDMNPIQLNAPTASLKGMDGKKRIYEVSWNNNTLCGEEYNLTYSTPSYEGDITLGESIEVEDAPVTINVEVDGYTTGTLTIDELDVQGFEMHRKYELAEDALHDWDFENLTTEQNQKIVGQYVIGEDPETEESIMLDAGWYYDSTRKRAFRNCDVVTTVIDAEFDEEGNITNLGSVEVDGVKGVNRVSNESDSDLALLGDLDASTHLLRETCDGFVEDKTGIFDGLTIEGCAPYINSSNVWASDFGYYVENGATYSGFWPTSRATITVNNLKPGDYVFYCVTGVINAAEVPAEASSLSFSIAKSSYLNYIDVYTCDDEAVAIESAKAEATNGPVDVYTIDGQKVKSGENIAKAIQGLKKGVYVVGGKKIAIK
jgi:hypothetical protein